MINKLSMNCNYSLLRQLIVLFMFLIITANTWAMSGLPSCTAQALITSQSETDPVDEKTQDGGEAAEEEEDEDDEEPECD